MGGIYESLRTVAITGAAGMPCRVDSVHWTAISDTVNTHLGLTIENLVYPGAFAHLYLAENIVKSGGLYHKVPFAYVPDDRPGLGLEIDEDLIEKLRI